MDVQAGPSGRTRRAHSGGGDRRTPPCHWGRHHADGVRAALYRGLGNLAEALLEVSESTPTPLDWTVDDNSERYATAVIDGMAYGLLIETEQNASSAAAPVWYHPALPAARIAWQWRIASGPADRRPAHGGSSRTIRSFSSAWRIRRHGPSPGRWGPICARCSPRERERAPAHGCVSTAGRGVAAPAHRGPGVRPGADPDRRPNQRTVRTDQHPQGVRPEAVPKSDGR